MSKIYKLKSPISIIKLKSGAKPQSQEKKDASSKCRNKTRILKILN